MRRSRTRKLGSLLLRLGLVSCAIAWCVGRVLSDRYGWSQPVSWVPPLVLAGPVWVAVALAWGVRRSGRKPMRGGRGRRRGRAMLVIGCVFVVVSLGHFVLVELGALRVFGGASGPGVRVVFWNQAGQEVGDISPRVLAHDPTLFVLANRHSGTATRDIAQAFIDTGEAHAAVGWPFDLFGRLPVRRWASTSLGLEGRSRTADGSTRDDPGWAAWFELETERGPLVVWAVDLPSDPSLARYPLAEQAGGAIAAWRGGARVVAESASRGGPVGFPRPDVIVGDFNIPRGSASLRAFARAAGAGGVRDAFAVGGAGWDRTWPRETPVWAIDHCFVGEGVSVRSFATPDPGVGGHRMLVVEFVRE